MGKKYEFMYRICRSRINGIEEEEDRKYGEGHNPSILQRVPLPLLEDIPRFPPFREGLFTVSVALSLLCMSIRRVAGKGCGSLTLRVPGDGGLTSKVASAGTPVSPALISPPRPLDFLRRTVRVLSFVLGPERLVNLSPLGDARSGNASVGMSEGQEQIVRNRKRFKGRMQPSWKGEHANDEYKYNKIYKKRESKGRSLVEVISKLVS